MSASEPVPDIEEDNLEEAAPENKLTSDNLAEAFWKFKNAFDFFYSMDPSMKRALKLKLIVEEENCIETLLKKWKGKNSRNYTECTCLFCHPFRFLYLLCLCHP